MNDYEAGGLLSDSVRLRLLWCNPGVFSGGVQLASSRYDGPFAVVSVGKKDEEYVSLSTEQATKHGAHAIMRTPS